MERFFPQVVADADGLEAGRRGWLGEEFFELVEELAGRELLVHDLEGEGAEGGRLVGKGIGRKAPEATVDRSDGAEVLQDSRSGVLSLRIVGVFDALAVSATVHGDRAEGLGRHAYYISRLFSKRFCRDLPSGIGSTRGSMVHPRLRHGGFEGRLPRGYIQSESSSSGAGVWG